MYECRNNFLAFAHSCFFRIPHDNMRNTKISFFELSQKTLVFLKKKIILDKKRVFILLIDFLYFRSIFGVFFIPINI